MIKEKELPKAVVNNKLITRKATDLTIMSYDKNVHKLIIPTDLTQDQINDIIVLITFRHHDNIIQISGELVEDKIEIILPNEIRGLSGEFYIEIDINLTDNRQITFARYRANVVKSDIDSVDLDDAQEFYFELFDDFAQKVADNSEIAVAEIDAHEQSVSDKADTAIAVITDASNSVATAKQSALTSITQATSDFTADVATKQSDVASKYNAFDASVTQANQTIDDILALQPQFQAVLDETTGKDVISMPEIILARGEATTLGERLDSEKAEFSAQLAQKAKQVDLDTTNAVVAVKTDKSYVDALVQAGVSGSPKGVYATVSALTSAFPNGNSNIYTVLSDGGWYYWNGVSWEKGGTYQASSFKTYKGQLQTGENIDDIKTEGQRLVEKSKVIGTLPSTASAFSMLDVQSVRNNFIVQRLSNLMNENYKPREYIRTFYNSWSPWAETTEVFKTYKRSLTTGDNIDTFFNEGQYYVTKAQVGGTLPDDASAIAMLDIQSVGSNFVVQRLANLAGSTGVTKEFIRTYFNTWSPWAETTNQKQEVTITSPWSGKTANFLGDSITAASNSYIHTVGSILGLGKVNNYGVGGGRFCVTGDSAIDDAYTPLVRRYQNIDMTADIIFVLIGTNDYSSQVPLGDPNSASEMEFNGGLNILMDWFRDNFPDKLVIFSTLLHRLREGDPNKPIVPNIYRQAIRDRCEDKHFVCYDAYMNTGFDFSKSYYDKILSNDGLHPNERGHEILGRKVAGFINIQ